MRSSIRPPGSRCFGCGDRMTRSRTLDSGSGSITIWVWSGRPGSTSTVALTSLAPDGLIVRQVFFHSPGSAWSSSWLNGRFRASSSTCTFSGSSPLGSLPPGSFWTSPLAVMTAWPFRPRMPLKTQRSGCSSSRPVRLRIVYGSLTQVISHRSLRSISASMAIFPSGRPAIGTRETLAWPLTVPLGLNWSTTLRTSGLSASSNVLSIGTDSAVMSSLTTASGPGSSMVPVMCRGWPPTLMVRTSTASVFFFRMRVPVRWSSG